MRAIRFRVAIRDRSCAAVGRRTRATWTTETTIGPTGPRRSALTSVLCVPSVIRRGQNSAPEKPVAGVMTIDPKEW